ncbi:MAG: bifunctional nuclease family protein, partial [Deltaproteobacteria bacterium]
MARLPFRVGAHRFPGRDLGTRPRRLENGIAAAKGKGGRELPIWIGPFEAQAIAAEIQGVPLPRPLTHDLMKRLVESLGARLDRVVIGDLRDNTYFATLHLAGADGKDISLDARPSDAIALALRLHGPILVA